MINQRQCPFCKASASASCSHLALAVEARDFVRRCIDCCNGQHLWNTLCQQSRATRRAAGLGPADSDDFTWLESAFCEKFLKHLPAFAGLDYEWRTGPKQRHGGFWVVLWSKEPRKLWWELRDDLEARVSSGALPLRSEPASPWQVWLTPR